MTDEERTGALASVVYVAYLGILALAGAWVAPYVIYTVKCISDYLRGK